MTRSYEPGMNKDFARSGPGAAMPTALFSLASAIVVMVSSYSVPARGATLTFDPPKRIVGNPAADAEPPLVAVAGTNAYLTWHEFPLNSIPGNEQPDIFFSRSTNSGGAFSPRVNLSRTAAVDSSGEQVAASGDNVAVVWVETDPQSFQSEVFVRVSTDRGVSFKPSKKVTGAGNPSIPRVSVSGDNVFVAWQADGQGGNPEHIPHAKLQRGEQFRQRDKHQQQHRDIGIPRSRTEADGSVQQ